MLRNMKTYAHLKPGQKGTRRLLEKYGDALICVRYRYDEVRGIRMKTIEIVVEEKPLHAQQSFKESDIVPVAVQFNETELRNKLSKLKARWDPAVKLWMVPYRLIRGTELECRISVEFLNNERP